MDTSTVCARCLEANETQRSYCWICYRLLASPPTPEDYRKLLRVNESCSPDELKQAYRRLAFKYHPDRNPGQPQIADTRLKFINEAYESLSGVKPPPILSPAEPSHSTWKTPKSPADLESILGDFAFTSRPSLLDRLLLHPRIVWSMSAIAITIICYELIHVIAYGLRR